MDLKEITVADLAPGMTVRASSDPPANWRIIQVDSRPAPENLIWIVISDVHDDGVLGRHRERLFRRSDPIWQVTE